MASSSPISKTGSPPEENTDPSVSKPDGQIRKPNSKNKNETNQKKIATSDVSERGVYDGEKERDNEGLDDSISSETPKLENNETDSKQPGSDQRQQNKDDLSLRKREGSELSDCMQLQEIEKPSPLVEDLGPGQTDSMNDKLVRLQNENEDLKLQVKRNKVRCAELKKKKKEYKTNYYDRIEEIERLQNDIKEKEVDNQSIIKLLVEKGEEVQIANSKVKKLEEDVKKRDNEIKCLNDARKQVEEANHKVSQLKQYLTKKEDEIKSCNEERKILERNVKKLENEKSKLKETLDDKLNKICTHQNKISDLKCEIEKQNESIKDMKRKLSDSTNQNEKKIKDLQKLTKLGKELEDEKTKLKRENHRLSFFEKAYHSVEKQITDAGLEISKQQSTIQSHESTIQRLLSEIKWYRNETDTKAQMIFSLEDEKESLLLRLSKITGAQLTYNNPNIADLSDDKRPTKLAEEFSELYDNEWTDAFECIEAENDDGKTQVLYNLLKKSYEFCQALSNGHDEAIRNSFTTLNYMMSLPEVVHVSVQTNSSNESQGLSKDKMKENDTQSTPDATNGNINTKNEVIKENVENTCPTQNSTVTGNADGVGNLDKADKNENKQHDSTGKETEVDKNMSPPQQSTDSGNADEVGNLDKADKNLNKQHDSTGEETEVDKNTSPPQLSTDSGNADEVGNLDKANKNKNKQHDNSDGDTEVDKNASLTQHSTDSGRADEVGNLEKADKNENKQHNNSGGKTEVSQNTRTTLQDTGPGNADKIVDLDKADKNENKQDNNSGGETEVDKNTRTTSLGTVSGSDGEVDNHNLDKTVKYEQEKHNKTEEAEKNNENRSSLQEITESEILDKDKNPIKSDENEAIRHVECTSVCHKKQVKVSKLTFNFDDLSAEQKKTIMDLRKFCEEKQTNDVVQVGSELIATEMQMKNGEIMKYISKCIDICWSMRRHTPPVFIDYSKSEKGLPFDKQKYRPYTKSGKFVHFVVWPVLYLHEGGPQLSKGVAQGIN